MFQNGRRYGLALMLGLWVFASPQAADLDQGRDLASTCLGCHGVPSYTNVYPTYHVPKLGGQHPEYIVVALKAYQSGERSHRTMQAHAQRFTDQQMHDIAMYFASIR